MVTLYVLVVLAGGLVGLVLGAWAAGYVLVRWLYGDDVPRREAALWPWLIWRMVARD